MEEWKGRVSTVTSFLICAVVAVLATLLYPLILALFSSIALLYPLYRRLHPSSDPTGQGAAGEEGGR